MISFETAKKIKDAGFPQPMFDAGQVWYDADFTKIYPNDKNDIATCLAKKGIFIDASGDQFYRGKDQRHLMVYAPTIEDFLRLYPGAELSYHTNDGRKEWLFFRDAAFGPYEICELHKDIFEVCANGFLYDVERRANKEKSGFHGIY